MPSDKTYKKNRKEFAQDKHKNVFIIMRFSDAKPFKRIERTIKITLERYGLKGILANDVKFDELLWENVRFCLENCRYAIVVFEQILKPDFNPNVALELGYILALGKPCLILKDSSMDKLQSDIMGHLYEPFDSYNLRDTIGNSIEKWLLTLGHNIIKPQEVVTDQVAIEAYKKRTLKIIEELNQLRDLEPSEHVIRQAASLSSLAISNKEYHKNDDDTAYLNLLINERDILCTLIEKGFKVKLIVFPFRQVARVKARKMDPEYVRINILTRYSQLIETINKYIDKTNLQIVYSDTPHYENFLVIGNSCVCVGQKSVKETGLSSTTFIYEPSIIGKEIDQFDIEFKDHAGLILNLEETQSKDHSSKELKVKVLERLKLSEKEIKNELRKLSTKSTQ